MTTRARTGSSTQNATVEEARKALYLIRRRLMHVMQRIGPVIYVREILPSKAPRTQTDNLKELAFLREFFDCDPRLDEIQPVHITQYMRWHHKKAVAWYAEKKRTAPPKAGRVRANREIALFSHIFNNARAIGLTSTANPCLGIEKNAEAGRDVYVEDDLYDRLYAHADEPTRDAMDLPTSPDRGRGTR